mmetsp:Transcript_787/g.2298  ORF Transcript_787/g.2298 Transcript_787/m.2298 type:complete len:177 (+) Transcript_787:1078-1608(+)
MKKALIGDDQNDTNGMGHTKKYPCAHQPGCIKACDTLYLQILASKKPFGLAAHTTARECYRIICANYPAIGNPSDCPNLYDYFRVCRQAFIDVTHRLEFLCIAFHNAFYDWQVANGQPHLGTEQMCRDFAASLTEKTSKNLANHPLARLFDPDAPMEWMPFLVPQDDPRSYVVIGI